MGPARFVQPVAWRLAARVGKWEVVAGLLQFWVSSESSAARRRCLDWSLLAFLLGVAAVERPGTIGSVRMETWRALSCSVVAEM